MLQLGAGFLLSYTPSNPLLVTFAIFIGLLLWFRLNGIVMLVAAAWIAVHADDQKIPLLHKSAADRLREEHAALVLAAHVRLRTAREARDQAPWYRAWAADRAIRQAQDELAAVEASAPPPPAHQHAGCFARRRLTVAARLTVVSRRVRIASVNVNGIRAAARKGMLGWLDEADVDILALQEVRASEVELRAALPGWDFVNDEALAKGRAGVAVAGRLAPVEVRREFADEALDTTGRWIETDFDIDGERLTVVSAYVYTGEAETARQDAKWAFLDAMETRMPQLEAATPARRDHGRPERRAP